MAVIAALPPSLISLDPDSDYVGLWLASQTRGYGGGLPGWLQVKGVTNGLPQGLPGDTRTPAVLNTAENLGLFISSGSYRLTTAATYNEVLFSGAITISATNGPLIFNRCRFRGNPSAGAVSLIRATAAGVYPPQCYDCDLDAGGVWADSWLGPSGRAWGYGAAPVINCAGGYTLVRCYLHNCVHCLDNPSGGAVIDQCYMDNIIQSFSGTGDVSHNDIIQWWGTGSTGCQLTNSYLDCYNYDHNTIGNTAVIQNGGGWTTSSVMHNVLVDSCLFSHGGYQARVDDLGVCDVSNYRYNNNRFMRNATYGVNAGVDSRVGWTNNHYTDGVLIP